MKKSESNSIVKNAELIKAGIITSSIGLVLLLKNGVAIGTLLFNLIH